MNVPRSFKVTYILIFLLIQRSEQDCPESPSAGKCCVDYYYKDGTCKPCKRGYFGPNCEQPCPYPSYGYRCVEGKCDCPLLQCDFSVGCVEGVLPTSTDSLQLPSDTLSTHSISTITLTTASNKMSDGRNSYDDNPNDILDKSSLLLVVIISSSSSIAVSVIVVVIVVCRRTRRSANRRKTENKEFTSKNDVRVTSIASYDEIDDRKIALSSMSQQQDTEQNYEGMSEENVEKYKYTTLPPRVF